MTIQVEITTTQVSAESQSTTASVTEQVTEVGALEQVTTLVEVGIAGPQGAQGISGEGLPQGGTTNQIIQKVSDTDQDVEWTSEPTFDGVSFATDAGLEAEATGQLVWDADAGTVDLGMIDGVTQRVGEDLFYRVQAVEAITKGDLLMAVGTVGNSGLILAAKSAPTYGGQPVGSQNLMGLASSNIAQGERGYVTAFGRVRQINTTAFEEGDILWADPDNAGGLTKTRPEAPNWKTIIALVITKSEQVGTLQVRPTFGSSLANDELAHINGVSDNDILRYNQASGRFETEALDASGTEVDVSGFSGLLSASDTSVQLALSTLDGVSLADLGITATDITNWNTAYGWGDHASAGYLTSFTETDPTVPSHVKAITTTQVNNWDTAYGWGDHASAGYLTSETVTSLTLVGNNLTYTDENGTSTPIDLSVYLDEDARAIASGVLNGSTGIVTFTRDDSTTFTLDLSALLGGGSVDSVNGQTGIVVIDADDIADGATKIIPTATQETNWDTAFSWGDHALAGYLTSYTESDPVFTASPAGGITGIQITNWDSAYSWGDHALAGYLTSYTESDPIFTASPASGITGAQITNWDTAYGWGDHSTAGYLTSYTETDPTVGSHIKAITTTQITNWDTAYGWGDHALAGYLTSYTESDPVFSARPASGITLTQIGNWDTAYGWGDHSAAGYLTSETDPTVASHIKAITSAQISNWDTAFSWGDHSLAGYLTSFTETDPVFTASPAGGITATQVTNWDTAYSWGDHALAGYLTSYTESDPVFIASPAGSITATQVTNWDTAYSWGDHSTAGYLTAETDTLDDVTGRGATTSNNIRLNDNAQLQLGNDGDLKIYHDGLNSYIDETVTGNLHIRAHSRTYIQNYATGENHIIAIANGSVDLYYDNLKKLATASTGVEVTGVITATGGNSTNWNTAYSWGDHSTAGYALSSSLGTMSTQNANNVAITGGYAYLTSLGIGTTSPAEKLHVNGAGETALVTPIAYGSNQDSAYLIASASNYDGTTTNWGTKGFSHRIKSDGSGVPRITIETPLGGEALAILGSNAHTVINKTLELNEDYTETHSNSTGNTTINLSNGTVFLVTTNGNNTITLPSASVGKSFIVGVGYTGTHSITWAGGTSIKWVDGVAPTLTSESGKVDIFSFFQTATETYGIPVAFNVS